MHRKALSRHDAKEAGLGRNYSDVCAAIHEFMRRGVVVTTVINGLVFDGATKDPMQQAVRDALIGFMAALSQAQAEATKAAQQAGIEHARATAADTKYRGRKPSYTRRQLDDALAMLGKETNTSAIAKAIGLSRQTVLRIKADPAKVHRSRSFGPTIRIVLGKRVVGGGPAPRPGHPSAELGQRVAEAQPRGTNKES